MSIKTMADRGVKRRKTSHASQHKDVVQLNESEKPSGNIQQALTVSTSSTSSATRSGLLAIQATGLADTVKAQSVSLHQDAKPFIDRITSSIKTIPEGTLQSFPSLEKSLSKQNIAIPFGQHRPASDVKYQFQYQPPQAIDVSHSLLSGPESSGNGTIELLVQMPQPLLQEKDYLNCRVLHKRAAYLACLTQALKKDLGSDFSYAYTFKDGNSYIPALELSSISGCPISRFLINVTIPSQVWPADKCLPWKNCLRSMQVSTPDGAKMLPTPLYNGTLQTLSSASIIQDTVRNATKTCEAYAAACSLGEVWLRQRGLTSSSVDGGFGAHEWSAMCALLLTAGGHKDKPLFSPRYSSIQLFKAMLQVLSGRNMVGQPMCLRSDVLETAQVDYPIFYDGITGVNFFYKMSIWSYRALMRHALLSLNAANARLQDNFEPLFLLDVAESSLDFDEVWSIDISGLSDGISPVRPEKITQIFKILERGLGDRVTSINIKQRNRTPWSIGKVGPKNFSNLEITVCLHINPANVDRTVDHGPSAEEQEESKDFRSFWGEKSELRRFRDGSITETLVWSADTSITLQIIRYLIGYHFKLLPSSIKPNHRDLALVMLSDDSPVKAADAFDLINTKYQELSSKLHQLEGLPLPIRAVGPADAALRYASAGHPLDPATAQPINMLIQFDSSARWPDNLAAIQHTKIAFLAKLSDLLTEADSLLEARLGIENEDGSTSGYLNTSFLDIAYQSPVPGLTPLVYRIRILHDREQHLLQSALATATGPTKEALTSAITEYKRQFIASPTHTAAIRNLTTQFPSLSPTVRLLKRWTASHHLANHIAPETLETIATRIFLQPFPWSTPGSSTTAFLRCLHLFAHWDWSTTPLRIDLSPTQDGLATPESHKDLDTRFQAWRKLDPAMSNVAYFIGTNIDPTGTIWTSGAHPPRVVASRITALAKAAIQYLATSTDPTNLNISPQSLDPLFTSPLSDFDFVLRLHKSLIRSSTSTTSTPKPKFKNLHLAATLASADLEHVHARDIPGLYVDDLERAFGGVALFFYGGPGSGVVGGLWRPGVVGGGKEREWRVRLGWSSLLVEGDGVKCVANTEGMLADMAMLGEGVVKRITVRET